MGIMKNSYLQIAGVLIIIGSLIGSCKHDPIIPDPEPTFCEINNPMYSDTIKAIISLNCSYTGCHGAGAVFGDFTSYASMLSRLDNGKIEERVIDMKDDTMVGMPPYYAAGPVDLTDSELELFKCWLDNGHPE